GVSIGDGVFVGPGAVLTNDRTPRAVTPEGMVLSAGDWEVARITVADGASIGANATVVAGVRIGAWAMIGAGAVVTRDVAAHAVMLGVPALRAGSVGFCVGSGPGCGQLRVRGGVRG